MPKNWAAAADAATAHDRLLTAGLLRTSNRPSEAPSTAVECSASATGMHYLKSNHNIF
jgi:hypothetical protein